jgi:hypothetical protein
LMPSVFCVPSLHRAGGHFNQGRHDRSQRKRTWTAQTEASAATALMNRAKQSSMKMS